MLLDSIVDILMWYQVVRSLAAGRGGAARSGCRGRPAQGEHQAASLHYHTDEALALGDNIYRPSISGSDIVSSCLFQVSELLRALIGGAGGRGGVCSKEQLLQALKEDKAFLSEQLQAFLKSDVRKQFRTAWSQLAKSAAVS